MRQVLESRASVGLRRPLCVVVAAALLSSILLAGDLGASVTDHSVDRLVPILMYHHITDDVQNAFCVSPAMFRTQVETLREAGYETISFTQLMAYVELGRTLPKRPVMITFDDGYASVVTIAAPILAQNGMCAAVSVIGVSVGKTTYKDSGAPIIAHFSFEEVSPWADAGVLEVISHSFDMHNSRELDREHYREGVLPMAGESEGEYAAAFKADLKASRAGIVKGLGVPVKVYSYPFGLHTELSEGLLSKAGIKVTLTSEPGTNTVVRGLPQSLRCLKRWSVGEDTSPAQLLECIGGGT